MYIFRLLTLLVIIGYILAENAQDGNHWRRTADAMLKQKLKWLNRPVKPAKNIIFFLGDGMGTVVETVSRVYVAQTEGLDSNQEPLYWQKHFPFLGLVQTYDVDRHVTDSASSATAYLTGVKSQYYTVGVNSDVNFRNCPKSLENPPMSIAAWAIESGKKAGFVTNTRLTHATPSALYAHTADRDWEDQHNMPSDASQCQDVAAQFVENFPATELLVAMGGGRRHFLPNNTADYEDSTKMGQRSDGRNLVEEWKKKNPRANFVWNVDDLKKQDPENKEKLLGLFAYSHMEYQLLVDKTGNKDKNPTLTEMMEIAVKKLAANTKGKDDGFFLLVEAGRIDHGMHDNNAKLAVSETHELNRAVKRAVELSNLEETLIIVTADHSHAFDMIGYPDRKLSILDKFDPTESFELTEQQPLTTILQFSNGPARIKYPEIRKLDGIDTTADDFLQPTFLPAQWDTHGGEDVAFWSKGPGAEIFMGLFDNTFIPRAMAYILCVGKQHGQSACDEWNRLSASERTQNSPVPGAISTSAYAGDGGKGGSSSNNGGSGSSAYNAYETTTRALPTESQARAWTALLIVLIILSVIIILSLCLLCFLVFKVKKKVTRRMDRELSPAHGRL